MNVREKDRNCYPVSLVVVDDFCSLQRASSKIDSKLRGITNQLRALYEAKGFLFFLRLIFFFDGLNEHWPLRLWKINVFVWWFFFYSFFLVRAGG